MSNGPKFSHIKREVEIQTAKSGGPGGQHVNKVETKVILRWDIKHSNILDSPQRARLLDALAKRVNQAGELIISVDSQRSQIRNKNIAYKKLDHLVKKAFTFEKKRIATKPSKSANRKRLKEKKKHGEKKAMRKNPEY